MKMTSIILLSIISLLVPRTVGAQDPSEQWTREELREANTAGNAEYLTGEEKDIVIYMNLARMDGERFFETYFQDFVDSHNEEMRNYSNYEEMKISRNDSYYRSLKRDLAAVKGLPMLWPDEALTIVSRQHARDMNKNNFAGHTSSDGRTANIRISKVYPKKSNGENLAFGFKSGLANVCMLLLDKGVPNLGHRKTILNSSYNLNTVGVSIQPHRRYRYAAVIDFVSK